MKKLILIVLLSTSFSYSQNSLTVNLLHCKNLENNDIYGFNEIVLYKNDSIYKTDKSSSEFKFFENMPEGKYKIKYNNFFGDLISESFVLDNKKPEYTIDLCIDKISYQTKAEAKNLFIQRIQNGEVILINCHYSGCFASSSHQMTITKRKNKLYLSYNKIKNRKLSNKDISSLMNYEIELRNIKQAGYMSTANEFNEIKYNDEIFAFKINAFWSGFGNLKKDLKIK